MKVSNEEISTALVCYQYQKTLKSDNLDGMATYLGDIGITIQNSINLGPDGKRKRGRPISTGKRTEEVERNQLRWNSWWMAGNSARDRTKWLKLPNGHVHRLGYEEDLSKLADYE